MGRAGVGEEGIIPRLCQDLFNKIGKDTDTDTQYSVEVRLSILVYIFQFFPNNFHLLFTHTMLLHYLYYFSYYRKFINYSYDSHGHNNHCKLRIDFILLFICTILASQANVIYVLWMITFIFFNIDVMLWSMQEISKI